MQQNRIKDLENFENKQITLGNRKQISTVPKLSELCFNRRFRLRDLICKKNQLIWSYKTRVMAKIVILGNFIKFNLKLLEFEIQLY